MNLKILCLLLPAAALLFGPPAFASTDADQQKELEQARKELEQARDELKRAAAEMARVARERDPDSPRAHAFEFLADPDRAVLGISIAAAAEKDGVVRGVRITAVTPGSGADQAGLKSGDLLTSANGKPLSAKSGEAPGAERKLLDVMGELRPGDTVKLDYERDGKSASVSATAGRAQDTMMSRRMVIPDIGPMLDFENDDNLDIIVPPPPPPGAPHGAHPLPPIPPLLPHIRIWDGDAWDLAGIDADLAPYFKTDSGVLVIKPPKDSKLGLKGGDVVQKINGDAVKDADALRRKLHALAGKDVALDIVRQGKSQSVKGALPRRDNTRVFKKRIEIENGAEDDPS